MMRFFRTEWFVIVLLSVLTISLGYVLSDSAIRHEHRVDAAAAEAAELEPTFRAFYIYFQNLAREEGGAFAFDVLRRAAIPAGIDIHLLGHTIGDELYKQEGLGGMRVCTHDFRNACSHSVVIGAMLERGLGVLDGDIHDACAQAPGGSGAYTMCFHGFGHGALAFAGYDVEQGIDICKRVGTPEYSEREYHECVGGLTMEMVSGVHDPALWKEKAKEYLDPDDPLAFCELDVFPEDARDMCYTYVTPQVFEAAGSDLEWFSPDFFARSFSYCADVPSAHRDTCYASFGKEFVVLAQGRDIRDIGSMKDEALAKVHSWCALAGDASGERSCLRSALNSLFWGGENDPEASVRFCATVDGEGTSTECFSWLFDNVETYRNERSYRKAFCEMVPNDETAVCEAQLL